MDDVRVAVLTGEGKVFCAGADLTGRAEMNKGPGDLVAHSRRTRECFHAICECAKPVVVAIDGAALGARAGQPERHLATVIARSIMRSPLPA